MSENSIQDAIMCPVCAELMSCEANYPMVLSTCGHSCCKTCLRHIERKGNSLCPICRERIDKNTKNILLFELIQETQKLLNISPPEVDICNFPEPVDPEIQELMDLGCTEQDARQTLEMADGDYNTAALMILDSDADEEIEIDPPRRERHASVERNTNMRRPPPRNYSSPSLRDTFFSEAFNGSPNAYPSPSPPRRSVRPPPPPQLEMANFSAPHSLPHIRTNLRSPPPPPPDFGSSNPSPLSMSPYDGNSEELCNKLYLYMEQKGIPHNDIIQIIDVVSQKQRPESLPSDLMPTLQHVLNLAQFFL